MDLSSTEKYLEKIGKKVIAESQNNLLDEDKNVTGKLSNSLTSQVTEKKNGFLVSFFMDYYGKFVDQGVKGVKSNYIVNKFSPYSYKSKGGKQGLKGMPPPKVFDGWTVRRGIAPRDAKGRFLPRKSLDFAIARSIFEKGIKATFFFTKPFDKGFIEINKELEAAISVDFRNDIKKAIQNK